jgi:hypothetical protein
VVSKHTHKTLKFDFFNHHQYHHQAQLSSKKYAHLSHLHHLHFVSVNKLHLSQHHPHLFSVKDHHSHQLQLLHKLLSVVWLVYQFHHDRSSSNVFHPSHPNHVTSSSNDGFHMVLKLNDEPSSNVLLLPKHTLLHATSSSNTNQFKFVLFVNSNVSVLLKLTHKPTFNNMVLNSLKPVYSFNKLVLLVLLKISQLQLLLLL